MAVEGQVQMDDNFVGGNRTGQNRGVPAGRVGAESLALEWYLIGQDLDVC